MFNEYIKAPFEYIKKLKMLSTSYFASNPGRNFMGTFSFYKFP